MMFFNPFIFWEALAEGLLQIAVDAYWQAEYDAISRSMS
jgi:hypothetical protein